MKIAIIAGGKWNSIWGKAELAREKFDLLICADGGANLALEAGVMPDVLLGDFDSVTPNNLALCREHNVKIIQYPAEKDQTDLELAVDYALEYLHAHGNPEDEIMLYAAAGHRLDHMLGNLAVMLSTAQKKRRLRLVDEQFSAWVMLPGKETVLGRVGQQLSIIPLSPQAEIVSHGLYYELNHLVLSQNTARGISNVLQKEQVELEVVSGYVLVVMNE